jgi:hypothetical protein
MTQTLYAHMNKKKKRLAVEKVIIFNPFAMKSVQEPSEK